MKPLSWHYIEHYRKRLTHITTNTQSIVEAIEIHKVVDRFADGSNGKEFTFKVLER